MSQLYEIKLTPSEVLLLDGKCSDSAQRMVDRVKVAATLENILSVTEADMVAKILGVARLEKKITYFRQPIPSCKCCGRKDGYYPVRRRTNWKRVGQDDRDNPKTFNGFNMDFHGVVMKHYIPTGCCESCSPKILPVLLELIIGIEADTGDVPGFPNDFKLMDLYECGACGWKGTENKVLPVPALFQGTYPGKCPSCKSVTHPLSGNDKEKIHTTGKKELVRLSAGCAS